MNTKTLLKKTALVATGTVPMIAMAGIQPASAEHGQGAHRIYEEYYPDYPNCGHMHLAREDRVGVQAYAYTQVVRCNYSRGLAATKIKYKTSAGDVFVTQWKFAPIITNFEGGHGTVQYLLYGDVDILGSCHMAGQEGLPWGPVYEFGDYFGWYNRAACSF